MLSKSMQALIYLTAIFIGLLLGNVLGDVFTRPHQQFVAIPQPVVCQCCCKK